MATCTLKRSSGARMWARIPDGIVEDGWKREGKVAAYPLIKAYAATFPSLFQPSSTMPSGIRAHIRAPEDLFNVQVAIYATYHMTDPKVFFTREDVWDVPTAQTSPGAAPSPVQT